MPRNIGADGRDVYRAVIAFTGSKGDQWTEHEGPYAKLGAARARVTFWSNHMASNGGSATGRVEQAHTVWAPVDSDQAEPEQYRTDAYGTPCYRHTDPDGDQFLAAAAAIPGQGPGIYFRTSRAGASIPLADLPQFIARLQTIADTATAEAAKEPTA
jgi:hypothetical protein